MVSDDAELHKVGTRDPGGALTPPSASSALSMFSFSVAALMKSAAGKPLLQAGAVVVGTFILEDAATVLAGMQVEDGSLDWRVALLALYIGIVAGDLGLYGLGRLASFWPWLVRWVRPDRAARGQSWLKGRVFRVVFVSRFVPGARLPTYTACGFLGAGIVRFAMAACCATVIWTTLLFGVSLRVGEFLMAHFGAWRWIGALVFALLVIAVGRLAVGLQRERE